MNEAAEAYRNAIPADCWHEPYMPMEALEKEIAAGVRFWGYESDGELIGVMGIQKVRDVDLIRHAYVLSKRERGAAQKVLVDSGSTDPVSGCGLTAPTTLDAQRNAPTSGIVEN